MLTISNTHINIADATLNHQCPPTFQALEKNDGLALIDVSSLFSLQSYDDTYLVVLLSISY